jgi:hypothetical protein
METNGPCLLDGVDPAKGQYVTFDENGLVAQSDDPGAVMDAARAKGVKAPVFVDLEIMRNDYIYAY